MKHLYYPLIQFNCWYYRVLCGISKPGGMTAHLSFIFIEHKRH